MRRRERGDRRETARDEVRAGKVEREEEGERESEGEEREEERKESLRPNPWKKTFLALLITEQKENMWTRESWSRPQKKQLSTWEIEREF